MIQSGWMKSIIAAAMVIGFFELLNIPRVQAAPPVSTSDVSNTAARPLMRFPDIHGDRIAFVYGEDIWSVSSSGGVATRLTINDGSERFPKFSPDGSLIAFTGEYDGNGDVYVMDAYGGDIRRVTFHPGYDEVIGWHPQSGKILFRSGRHSASRYNRLFLVSPDGTGIEELILNEAATGSYSPDAKRMAYNKTSRESRTWKRYRGGRAQDIYLWDFDAKELTNLTDNDATDRIPMWIGDKIYFTSDRNRVLNLFSVDPKTRHVKQLTHHTEYDIRRPSQGGSKIVYELGGSLWVFDTVSGKTGQVPIEIRADAPETRPWLEDVTDRITGIDISPSGKRALVVARGEVFSVPREDGPTRNLTDDSGSRDKDAAWSPDGKTIAYLSDKSGEYEIYLMDPQGKTESVKLTQHADGYRHTLRWSPDSQKIAFADQTLRCFYLDVETKKITEVDQAAYENTDVSLDLKPIYDFSWSPDSRFITYSKMNEDLVFQIFIYSLDEQKTRQVSNGLFNDFHPVFTRDGQHLLFVSNRRFDPTYCDFEWEMVYKDVAGIYAMTLQKDGPSILPYKNDEEPASEESDKEDGDAKNNGDEDDAKTAENKSDDKTVSVVIDFEGLADRVEAMPLPRSNYRNLAAGDDAIFYLNKENGDFNRFEYRAIGSRDLMRYSLDDREETTVVKGINEYKLAADGKNIVYRKGKTIGIVDASATQSAGDELDLSGLKVWLDPRLEWRQIFNEAWRMERDFYYEPGMHGIDWPAMHTKYGKLLPFASCRQDVGYIIGELIGELNTSHTYVFGGDTQRSADRVNVGMLGADYEVDKASGRYRFKKIYRVKGWTRDIEPPLTKQGVAVKAGDYLLAVNGHNVTTDRNLYSYFQGLAGKQVAILVNDKPTRENAKEYIVVPVKSESAMRYLDWVEHNRLVALRESNGQIGYIHMPDTYLRSAREFPKYFYSLTRKKGIIVDGRFNGGGLDPDIFLQRLDKELLAYWTRRYSHDQTTPAVVTRAHMVCITNRQAGSGGDMLPMEFKMRKMGPVIGTRSWGGLVGVSMFLSLIDGGGLSAPDYRIYDPKGHWIVENEGVTPDIEVDWHPEEMARGYDAQLMKAIEILKQNIEDEPLPWPKHDPYPVDKK